MTGRPTKMTDLVVKKLEEAFALGCTDTEACLYAGISKQTLYTYQQTHSEFIDRKELLKERPILEARKSIIKHIEDSGSLALRYLERKKKDEFGLKQIEQPVRSSGSISKLTDDELEDKIVKYLDNSTRYKVIAIE